MPGNTNYDEILSTSLANYRKSLEDNVFLANPLFYWLYEKKRRKDVDGGTKIVIPLMYGKNTTVKSYSKYDVLDVTPQGGITAAEYPWKQIAGSVIIAGLEERQNSAEAQIVDLLEAKILQCEESFREKLDEMAFSDGSGNEGKDILGLKALIPISPLTGTVGGIDRATVGNEWWRNKYDATGYTTWGGASDTAIKAMRSMYNNCSKGNIHTDLILTTKDVYGLYEGACVLNERFTDSKVADAGFENIKFKGATIMFDEYCTATYMYFLNSKYLQWIIDSQINFKNTPFQKPVDQDCKVSQILLMCELVISNAQRHGILSGMA